MFGLRNCVARVTVICRAAVKVCDDTNSGPFVTGAPLSDPCPRLRAGNYFTRDHPLKFNVRRHILRLTRPRNHLGGRGGCVPRGDRPVAVTQPTPIVDREADEHRSSDGDYQFGTSILGYPRRCRKEHHLPDAKGKNKHSIVKGQSAMRTARPEIYSPRQG